MPTIDEMIQIRRSEESARRFNVLGETAENWLMPTDSKFLDFANKEIGSIPEDKAEMIIQACDELLNNLPKYTAYFPSAYIAS